MRSLAFGVTAALSLCLCASFARADCVLLGRIEALAPLSASVLADGDPAVAEDFRRKLLQVTQADLPTALAKSGNEALVQPVQDYLARLSIVALEPTAVNPKVAQSMQEALRTIRRNADISSCREDSEVDLETTQQGDAHKTSFGMTQLEVFGNGFFNDVGRNALSSDAARTIGLGGLAAMLPLILILLLWKPFRARATRRHKRFPCRYATTITFGDEIFPCIVIDLSRTGLKITTVAELPRAKGARIALPIGEVAVTVAWRGEFAMGLVLETELPQNLMAKMSSVYLEGTNALREQARTLAQISEPASPEVLKALAKS